MPRCPVCDAAIDLEKAPAVPFCSDRCRLIDLGRWLDEGYAVPAPRRPADEDLDAGDGDDHEAA